MILTRKIPDRGDDASDDYVQYAVDLAVLFCCPQI